MAHKAGAGAAGLILMTLCAGQFLMMLDSSVMNVSIATVAKDVGTTVTGESVALHRGRTTMVWQTSVRNAEGKLCALVTQTQLVLSNES